MSQSIRVGDKGTEFRILIEDEGSPVDLSAATVLNITFKKPSGENLTVDAQLFTDGTDGIIYYNTVSGDINESGMWKMQAFVSIADAEYSSTIASFKVECNL